MHWKHLAAFLASKSSVLSSTVNDIHKGVLQSLGTGFCRRSSASSLVPGLEGMELHVNPDAKPGPARLTVRE